MAARELACLACAVSVAAGVAVAFHEQILEREALVVILAVVVLVPLAWRRVTGKLDPFEPILVAAAALFVLFVMRPAAHLIDGGYFYRGRSIEAGFDAALVIALVGVVALYAGYALPAGQRLAQRLPTPQWGLAEASAVPFATALVTVGLLLFGAFLASSGGLSALGELIIGRSYVTADPYADASAYLYFGPFLAVPAALILFQAAGRPGQRRMGAVGLAVAAGLLVIVLTGPRGDRIWLLTFLASVAVLGYLRARRRPRALTLFVTALVLFAVGITFLRDYREVEERSGGVTDVAGDIVQQPIAGFEEFILGPDTEMFSMLSMVAGHFPETTPHEPGATVLSLLAGPIPREVWAEKPENTDQQIFQTLFPEEAAVASAGPAPSVFGGFYYDAGYIGVIVGGVLVGVLFRVLYAFLVRDPANRGSQVIYAGALPFVIVLLRGNPVDTLPRAVYVLLPILLYLGWTSGARRGRTAEPGPLMRHADAKSRL